MKLLITRPVVLTGDGGTRSFVPGLTVEVEVDAATAEHASHSSPPEVRRC